MPTRKLLLPAVLALALLSACSRPPIPPAALNLAQLARECLPLLAHGEAAYHSMPPGCPELVRLVGDGWFGVTEAGEIRVVQNHKLAYILRHEDVTHQWVLLDGNSTPLQSIPDTGFLPTTPATSATAAPRVP